MEGLLVILNTLSPVLVASVGAYSAITVAKLTKMQKDIKTNLGPANIGEAIEVISSRVDSIGASQLRMTNSIDELRLRDENKSDELDDIEDKVKDLDDIEDKVNDLKDMVEPDDEEEN